MRLDPGAHARRADAFQVVAHAHVEDGVVAGREFLAQQPRRLQDLEEHRRADVLAQRLLQLQFLRPLDVVADVGGVDARPRDLQLVENLDGLQLDDARAAQPGEHDVLRQLTVRSGGRPERRGGAVAVKVDREIQPGQAAEELALRQVEDLAFPLDTRGTRAATAAAAGWEPVQPLALASRVAAKISGNAA